MGVVKNIFLPIDAEGPFEHIKTMQGNKDSLTVEITLLSGGMPISLAAGVTPRLQYQKPDGHIVEKECPVVNQKVVVEYTEQMLIVAGTAKGQIYYEEGAEGIYSSAWYTDIYPTVSGELEESSSEYNTINALINKAAAQATAASTSAKNANTSASSASASATKAFGYVEQCEAILEEMGYGTEIVGNGHGKVVTADDANGAELIELTAYGKSVQNTYSGKNYLENKAISGTTYGIKHTVNNDKSVNLTGTATNMLDLYVIPYNDQITMPKGRYKISGCPSGGSESTYLFIIGTVINGNSTRLAVDYGDGGELILEEDTEIYALCRVHNGITVNHTFYPMIRDASTTDDTYEPYVGREASPSPSYPQAITSVADDKGLVVKSCGKNLFNVNELEVGAIDKSTGLDIEDEPTRRTPYIKVKSNTQYVITDSVVVRLFFYDTNRKHISNMVINGGLFTTPSNCNYIRLHANYNDNPIFTTEFMLCEGTDATYEPYISTQANLTLADSLRGIPVTESGNYTDEDGQSWICDTVEKYTDGSGKLVQRVGHRVYDGVNVKMTNKSNSVYANIFGDFAISNVIAIPDNEKLGMYCSHFIYETFANVYIGNNLPACSYYRDGNNLRIAFPLDSNINTIDLCNEWLAEQYANGTPVIMEYVLAEPIETDLTAEQMAELEKLMSFEGYTTVSTDDMGEVAIQYFKGNDSGKIVGTVLELTKLNRENIDQLKTDSEQLEENIVQLEDNVQQFGETLSELESKDNITEIEKLIGRLGGKPLYRKLIKVDSIAADTSANIDSAKCVYNAYGRCKFSGSAEYMQIPNFIVYVSELNGMVTLTNRIGSATGGNVAVEKVEIVIEYTKAEAVG